MTAHLPRPPGWEHSAWHAMECLVRILQWRLKSPKSRLLVHQFIRADIQENMKALHCCFCEEKQRSSNAESVSMSWRDHADQGEEVHTVYPKKYAHGFCFAELCCGYTLTDFPISIRLTSLALWQSNDCPSASKATLMNMDRYFMWIHYERLHNHNKAKHNKIVCIFLGIYCMWLVSGTYNYIPAHSLHVISYNCPKCSWNTTTDISAIGFNDEDVVWR